MKGVITPCILWSGSHDRYGYSRIYEGKTYKLVHRIAFEAAGNALIAKMDLDHLCRNPGCVNPNHLEQVTHRENVLRGKGIAAKNFIKTHCNRGHIYDEANTRKTSQGRWCRKCDVIRSRAYKQRKNQGVI